MNLQKNILLKNYSTFRIGGPAKYFCECENAEELKEALNWAKKNNERVFILGGGSNILFGDNGFGGLVLKVKSGKLRVKSRKGKSIITCGAGVKLGKLVNFSIKNNLTGLEWAAGIPGTVGGAIRGNAGAFGGEMGDGVKSVKVLELKGTRNKTQDTTTKQTINFELQTKNFNREECKFSYRDSVFKRNRNLIIWEAEFELEPKHQEETRKEIRKILRSRHEKQPLNYPSAGSIFKNPTVDEKIIKQFEEDKEVKCKDEKVPAGWLIERCGLKGKQIGGARVSRRQANFIVNTGDAKASDILILISLIKQKVRNRFGVQLQEEIEIVI